MSEAAGSETNVEMMLRLHSQQVELLTRIAELLENKKGTPNYQIPLAEFGQFDWSTIGATVERRDRDGAATVIWRGRRYLRRSANNRFQPAIWFSRSMGKDQEGNSLYERLITFKELAEAEPLPEQVRRSS